MAVWEDPNILSGMNLKGQNLQQAGKDVPKAEIGICVLHQGIVTTEWAMRLRLLQIPPFVYIFNRNQPYDTAREQTTRALLENKDIKYIFHFDSDVLIPIDTIPSMIRFSEEFNLPILSGLYWAKKPNYDDQDNKIPPMPAAWLKTGEHKEENRYDFLPIDIKPHLNKGAIVKVDVTGAGCLLVKREVFEKLDKSNPNKPFFQWGLGRKNEETGKPLLQMSEDFYFCMRAVEELDIHPHLCCNVKCDHLATTYRRGADGDFQLSIRM